MQQPGDQGPSGCDLMRPREESGCSWLTLLLGANSLFAGLFAEREVGKRLQRLDRQHLW